MKYAVTIQRIEYKSHTFEVEADNKDKAEEQALEESQDYNFNLSIDNAHESVIDICPINP